MRRRFLSTVLLAVPFVVWAGEGDTASREPLRLSLKRAVEIATSPEGNTYIQLSDESVKQSKSRSQQARSALLPDIEAQASETTAMKSLAALGLGSGHQPDPARCGELADRRICSPRKVTAQ